MAQEANLPDPTQTPAPTGIVPDHLVLPVIVVALAYWCWFKRGPFWLRWPSVVILILVTSGNSLGAVLGQMLSPFAGPALILLIIGIALFTMIGGFSRRSSWRRDSRYDRRGGWNDRY
jgi:hypothetical protein